MKSKRAWLLLIFIFCAALCIAAWLHWKSRADAAEADLAGIEKLHQEDIAATLATNPDQLAALWADNAVLLGQDEQVVIGRQALLAAYKTDGTKVLKYTPHFQDLQIDGDIAYEWGYFEAAFQSAGQQPPVELHARFLRVMRKQKDKSWKFMRIMWQENKP